MRLRKSAWFPDRSFPVVALIGVTLLARSCVASSLQCCPPTISSIIVDHDELFDLPAIQDSGRRVASSLGR
jgi:hypothetical protein